MRLLVLSLLALCLQGRTFVLTVAGLGGEQDYEQRFRSTAQEIDKLLRQSGPDVWVLTLTGAEVSKPRIEAALADVARQASKEDAVALLLIGHGAFDGEDYKFNIPGPDLAATELGAYLDRIPAPRQLVAVMTSSSGAAAAALERPGRIVITATRSGTEKHATVFARYWAEALRDPQADTDKNEVISALEAFRYAERKTKEFYESQKRILTEHAVVHGQEAQKEAAHFALVRLGAMQMAARDPAKQALLVKREQLERQIDELKLRKAALPQDQYRKQLSALLLELARTQQELDR
jgi:hypothetical protein